MNFTSAFSSNAVSICAASGVAVTRIERYRRYALYAGSGPASPAAEAVFATLVHDRMTEWRVSKPLTSFSSGAIPAPVRSVPLIAGGMAALEEANTASGLSLDAWDRDYVYDLFVKQLGRDPTDVELFDFSQSNSEHSRHWFFRGKIVIDGVEQDRTLMGVVKSTLDAQPDNSVVAFADNSSAIRGVEVDMLVASTPGSAGSLVLARKLRHLLLTAETHNFPTGIAPHPGAETGTGGRLRDSHATGRGSHAIAGTAGYCVGALHVPGYALPWEATTPMVYPPAMAKPLQIEIEASNGASEYGNKFGEPVVAGFTRSVAMNLPCGERREYIKPIMFTAGIGAIEEEAAVKGAAGPAMVVVKLGGPAYRIGMGGSAASSMSAGDNVAELDFNAVQRGDAEMENKVNRVIRACCEMGAANPIISIHDQGAGGNCNVLKEIIAPAGGRIDIRAVLSGDATLSVLELWGAEYQEADALLIAPDAVPAFAAMCARERAPVAFVGTVTGDGRVVVFDSSDGSTPVDLPLDAVLGSMPQKTFSYTRSTAVTTPLVLPAGLDTAGALDRVLRLLSVGSKRFLTSKVDRAVTGLVAQQQCVGPLHTPLADVAVLAMSHFATSGVASSIGEQPVKGLANPTAAARMAVAESITNIASARITALTDAKCSANWMWAAKLPHEGAALWDAAVAMAHFMIATGVAVDGGKDSLSMAARLPDGTTVKAPGTLVISLYAPCPDVRNKRTPDLKAPVSGSVLIVVDGAAAAGQPSACRLGGSALAQVFGQVGTPEEVPDVEQPAVLLAGFNTIQALLDVPGTLLSIHDRSDGGLVTALLEMAFAGNVGLAIDVPASYAGAAGVLAALFSEEAGWVLEVAAGAEAEVLSRFATAGVAAASIGHPLRASPAVSIAVAGVPALSADMRDLRDAWESTSFALDALQTSPAAVAQEREGMRNRRAPPYALTFTPAETAPAILALPPSARPRVAVVREEGTNGDREMSAALVAAGFDAWDVATSDLLTGKVTLDEAFSGLVFPGGFSYGDVLDSAKGWAGSLRFNARVWAQLKAFYARPDTWSLGICNGCQLMALLGWVPFGPEVTPAAAQPRFVHNAGGRFQSRFATVSVGDSPAIMLAGMSGSILGVWTQHGEGRAHFPDATVRAAVDAGGLVPLRYVDDAGVPTEAYPANPNGSPDGIAGLCSPDGRHLALMPHPERCHRLWQWAWTPPEWEGLASSPWLRMFQNAREWAVQVR
jgi:phosphoribosylformylglycinamidine synthase